MTAFELPEREALISTVSPSGDDSLALAPALSNASISRALPLVAASASGVTPRRFATVAFAPPSISAIVISTSSAWTAQCRAVVPSPSAVFTSVRAFTSDRTAATSRRLTAVMRGLSANDGSGRATDAIAKMRTNSRPRVGLDVTARLLRSSSRRSEDRHRTDVRGPAEGSAVVSSPA